MRRTRITTGAVLALTALAWAQPWQQQAKLQPTDATEGFVHFGTAVSLHGDMAAVGSQRWDGVGDGDRGSGVRIYTQAALGEVWVERARIVAPEETLFGDNHFGAAIAMDETWLVIGAPLHGSTVETRTGAVFVYIRDGDAWEFHSKLTPSDGAINDEFGFSVSLANETIAVGSVNHDAGFVDTGAVYVYAFDGSAWAEQGKVLAQNPLDNARFGSAVALDDRGLLVGEISGFDSSRSGAAYWFELDSGRWTLVQRITPPIAGGSLGFGAAVAVEDTRMVITAPRIAFGSRDTGRAFAYALEGGVWRHTQTFNDPGRTRGFGGAVAMQSGQLAVSVISPFDGGAATLFVLEDGLWTVSARLFAENGAVGDMLGAGLAISHDRVLAGATGVDTDLTNLGAAYIFEPNPCPADLDGDGELTIFDFLAFQNAFDAMDPVADFDGDGDFTIFDFLAFQNAFDAGCP